MGDQNEESHQEAQNYSTVLREPLKGSRNKQGKNCIDKYQSISQGIP